MYVDDNTASCIKRHFIKKMNEWFYEYGQKTIFLQIIKRSQQLSLCHMAVP